ncbi:MAG: hypothetical protein IKJ30_00065 [Bacilli bacterium]|nr:hypothetical protein [Bacilli bacterium]
MLINCYTVMRLLGYKSSKYLDKDEYKEVMLDEELVKKAVKYDNDCIKEMETDIYADLEYLKKVKNSLALIEEYKDNEEYKKLDKLFHELRYFNRDYIVRDRCNYLSDELYNDVMKLDDSTLGNVKSKRIATYIKNHPLANIYAEINAPKDDPRYYDITSKLSRIVEKRREIEELIENFEKYGVPNKKYKDLIKANKKKRFKR